MSDAEKPEEPAERCHCDDCQRWERLEHPAEVDWTADRVTVHYSLEIYEPGSARNVLFERTAVTPFLPIHVGELISSAFFRWSYAPDHLLRVVGVRHILWDEDESNVMHRVCVFTRLEPNTPGTVLRPWTPGPAGNRVDVDNDPAATEGR